MTKFPPLVALFAALTALGMFLYVSQAASYAGTRSATCNNCHVMDLMYEGWYHAAHEEWAECVDCHLPHTSTLDYYLEKGRSGAHDVYVFSTGSTPDLIRASPGSKKIVQTNCIRCHMSTVDLLLMGVQPLERYCWDCHRSVAHGPRGLSVVPYQDSDLYPTK